jgi:hypothetical protein
VHGLADGVADRGRRGVAAVAPTTMTMTSSTSRTPLKFISGSPSAGQVEQGRDMR